MEVKAYYFHCQKDGIDYVACQDNAHASIQPIGDVYLGKRTMLVYNSMGRACTALKARTIHGVLHTDGEQIHKDQLLIRRGKLTLDI